MSAITDVVTEMSVATESSTYALAQSPVAAAVRGIRGSPLSAGPVAGTFGDAPDPRSAAGISILQAEDMRKSLRDTEIHVRILMQVVNYVFDYHQP